MKFEHILNMEYSLRDAFFLFWLIKEQELPLSFVLYQCEYEFLDVESYFLAINDPTLISQQKKRLQRHFDEVKCICEMANNCYLGTGNTALYASFFKFSKPNSFVHVEVENFGVKDKPAKCRYLTYLLELDLETLKPRWVVAEVKKDVQLEWMKLLDKSGYKYENKNVKKTSIYQIKTLEIFDKMLSVYNELNLLLDIKEEYPHKAIIDNLIPKHINERYREELGHIFSHGKYNKEQVKWMSGYKELQEFLYPHYHNQTIPNHYQNWCDFAMDNFTQKNGRAMNLKSLQNEFTRQNWENNSRNTQNTFPNSSRNTPEPFPNSSYEFHGIVQIVRNE